MKKTALFIILCSVMFAWGPRAQVEIIQTAGDIFEDDPFNGMTEFFDTYYAEMYSGAVFPDWSYAPLISDSYSDRAHEVGFGDAYLEYLMDEYPSFETDESKRELAFCMGLLSHIYSDRILKGENGEEGFLDIGATNDGISTDNLITYLDQFISHDYAVGDFAWYWPTSTILDVYDEYSSSPYSWVLSSGLNAREMAYDAACTTSSTTFTFIVEEAPWSYTHYGNYYPGGFYNCATLAVHKIRQAWNMAANKSYVFQRSQVGCGYQDAIDTHLLEYLPGNNCGGEDRLMVTIDGISGHGVSMLKWDITSTDTIGVVLDSAIIFVSYERPLDRAPTGSKPVYLYPLNRQFNEGTGEDGEYDTYEGSSAGGACWTHASYPGTAWASPGADGIPGDREGIPYGLNYFGPSTSYPTWYRWNVTTLVRNWLRNPLDNCGVMLREEENSFNGVVLFASSEDNDICQRPLLAIYQSPFGAHMNDAPKPEYVSLNVYPNPFNSAVQIVSDNEVSIHDLSGRLIGEIGAGGGVWQPPAETGSGMFIIKDNGGNSRKLVYMK